MSGEHYFSEQPAGEFKPQLIKAYLAGREVQVLTAAGIFSPEHVDAGTHVLLDHLAKAPSTGNILDIGCGWGPIALALALNNPEATIWAIDVNQRSLELTKQNATRLGLTNIKVAKPDEVPGDLEFDGIWSNPPIRVGKDALHEILRTWLPRLSEGGESYLVVAKQLGSDSLLTWMQSEFPELASERVDTQKGFRIIRSVSI